MEEKTFTCVACPMGCTLHAVKNGQDITVTGYSCKRGLVYGTQEMIEPARNISTTVRVHNGFLPVIPVKTSKPLPKRLIFSAMKEINAIELEAPVTLNQVIIHHIFGTDVDIIASRSLNKKGSCLA